MMNHLQPFLLKNISVPFQRGNVWCNHSYAAADTTSVEHSCAMDMLRNRFQNTSPYQVSQKTHMKRRGLSPKVFPHKIHITEEKVAEDLCNLTLSDTWKGRDWKGKMRSSIVSRHRTFSEIEDSLELSSDEEAEENPVQISNAFQKQIKDLKRDMLLAATTTQLKLPTIQKPDYSTALVLWKPPSGVVPDLIKTLPTKEVEIGDESVELDDDLVIGDELMFSHLTPERFNVNSTSNTEHVHADWDDYMEL